jgi:hypothetical protein
VSERYRVGDRVRWRCLRYLDHPDAFREATVTAAGSGFFHYQLQFDDGRVMPCMDDEVVSTSNAAMD